MEKMYREVMFWIGLCINPLYGYNKYSLFTYWLYIDHAGGPGFCEIMTPIPTSTTDGALNDWEKARMMPTMLTPRVMSPTQVQPAAVMMVFLYLFGLASVIYDTYLSV